MLLALANKQTKNSCGTKISRIAVDSKFHSKLIFHQKNAQFLDSNNLLNKKGSFYDKFFMSLHKSVECLKKNIFELEFPKNKSF